MIMAQRRTMRRHAFSIDEEAKIWRKFDAIIHQEGMRTRTAAFRQMIRSVVNRGKLPAK